MESLFNAVMAFPLQFLAVTLFHGHAVAGTALAEPAASEPPRPRAGNVMPSSPDVRGPWLEDDATVLLRVTIDAEGRVVAPQVLDGGEPFVTRAVSAVRHWRYEPAREGGRAVATSWDIRLRFEQPPRTSDRFASSRHSAPAPAPNPSISAMPAIGAVAATSR